MINFSLSIKQNLKLKRGYIWKNYNLGFYQNNEGTTGIVEMTNDTFLLVKDYKLKSGNQIHYFKKKISPKQRNMKKKRK